MRFFTVCSALLKCYVFIMSEDIKWTGLTLEQSREEKRREEEGRDRGRERVGYCGCESVI